MKKTAILIFLFTSFLLTSGFYNRLLSQDIRNDDYPILNGKLWRNLYMGVKGSPYFLTGEYINGDITFNGKVYTDRTFRYDVYNDQVVLWINPTSIIILNKEMIDEFTIRYLDKSYRVLNLGDDSTSVLTGFVNEFYDGRTPLYVKYRKEIEVLAVDNKYDLFIEMHKMYIKKDNEIIQFSGKGELLKLLGDRKQELKAYIKQKKLNISKNNPLSFAPLLEYYDTLKQ